jgi:hypothetical protein
VDDAAAIEIGSGGLWHFLLMISTLLGKAYAVNAPPWLHYHCGLAEAVFAVFYFRVERRQPCEKR